MGVMQPDISVTADPALLLQPATTGAVDSYFLSNDLDPNGSYAMFVLRPWKNLSGHLQAIVDAAIYVNQKHGLTPVFGAQGRYCAAPVTHKVTLGEIVDLLKKFHDQ